MKIKTNRLVIRDWCTADIEPYYDLVSKSEVMRFIGSGLALSKDKAKQFVIKSMLQDKDDSVHNRKVVALLVNDELIGCCGLKLCEWGLDFGWRYRFQFWKKGYATEAALILYQNYFETSIHDFVSVIDPENIGSKRVIEKFGMVRADEIKINGALAFKYEPRFEQST